MAIYCNKDLIKNGLFSPAKRKIILAPHYDDFILSLGGLAGIWKINNAEAEEAVVFSQTNFINDKTGSFDNSVENIAKISAIRYQEELKAVANLGKIKISSLGFLDASARGLKEVVGGANSLNFNEPDREILNNLAKKISSYLSQPLQLFVPLAIRFHQDHLLVKKAFLLALKQSKKPVAEIFFYEDLPYANANKKDWRPINDFIKTNKLITLTYPINLGQKLALVEFYPSQIDQTLYTGLIGRALKLAFKSLTFSPSERVYFWPEK